MIELQVLISFILYLTFKYESDNMTLISSVRRINLQITAQHLLALNL